MSAHMRKQQAKGRVSLVVGVVAGIAVVVAIVATIVLFLLPKVHAGANQSDKGDAAQEAAAEVVLSGTVTKETSVETANIVSDTTGVVQKVLVSEGEEVQKGAVLYTVSVTADDSQPSGVAAAQSKLAAAQSAYTAAKANYDSVMDSYDWAINNYEEAHAQWEFEHDMWNMQMYAYEQAVADAEWRRENAPDAYDEYGNPVAYIYYDWPGEEPVEPVLASELGSAQAQADERLAAAATAVETAQAELNAAQANTSSQTETKEVKAPVAGKVSALRVQEGMAVDPGDTQPLLSLQTMSEASVDATVEAGDGNDLTLGSTITLTVEDAQGRELAATVKSVSAHKVGLVLLEDDDVQDGTKVSAHVPVQADSGKEQAGEATPDASDAQDEATRHDAHASEKVDVSHVDYDVAAMTDEEAFQFMHDFTNRTPDEHATDFGKVLRIKGQVSRYAKMENGEEKAVSYSIGVKGEGGTIWAVNFYVEGWDPDDYPQNLAKAEVTGVYGEVDGYGTNAGKTLVCNAEDVRVIEE